MKKYTLLLSGLAATGSNSFWFSFGFHPEVARSKYKEILTQFVRLGDNKTDYLSFAYNISEKTKVLLDGSASPLLHKPYFNYLKSLEYINRICCIFRLRSSEDLMFSHCTIFIKQFLFSKKELDRPAYLDQDKNLNYEILKQVMRSILNQYHFINEAINLLGKENVFVIKLSEMFEKQTKIFNFLDVNPNIIVPPVILQKRKGIYYNDEHLKLMKEVEKVYLKNYKHFSEIIEKSNENISRYIKIE